MICYAPYKPGNAVAWHYGAFDEWKPYIFGKFLYLGETKKFWYKFRLGYCLTLESMP